MDMGKPFGKASGRTLIRNSRPLPITNGISPKVNSSNHIKNVKTTAFRSLEGRFAHVRYAMIGYPFHLDSQHTFAIISA